MHQALSPHHSVVKPLSITPIIPNILFIGDDVEESRNKHGLAKVLQLKPIIPAENVAAVVSFLVRDESKSITGLCSGAMGITSGLR